MGTTPTDNHGRQDDRVREATRGGRVRRGVTLFEVLVAMAVLVALGALALPNLADMLDRRKLDHQVDEVVGQMMLARAKAQSEGSMVELVFLPRAGRMVVRGVGRPSDAPRSSSREQRSSTAIQESWADKPVDPAIAVAVGSFGSGPIEDSDGPVASGPEANDPARDDPLLADASLRFSGGDRPTDRFVQDDDDDTPTRLAVFAGDGSAVFAGCCRLTDERGRVVLIAVNPWTGLPAIDRGAGDAGRRDEAPASSAGNRDDEGRGGADRSGAARSSAKSDAVPAGGATGSADRPFEFDDWP